jgi:hypothetical protein
VIDLLLAKDKPRISKVSENKQRCHTALAALSNLSNKLNHFRSMVFSDQDEESVVTADTSTTTSYTEPSTEMVSESSADNIPFSSEQIDDLDKSTVV